jgi:hypothetical protein
MLNKVLYIPYYLVRTDWSKVNRFMGYARSHGGQNRIMQTLDMVQSVFKYNIAPLDYYYFSFYNLNKTERHQYVGTGFMYEYQKIMNPSPDREILADKRKFLNHYKNLIKRKFYSIDEIRQNPSILDSLLLSGKIVLKNSLGQVGAEVEIYHAAGKTSKDVLSYMEKMEFDMVEAYVEQHPRLKEISPTGLNTVRVITQEAAGTIIILAARLRISVNSSVDNMAAGNLAAPLDTETGIITGSAVYSDITKPACEFHPVTGVKLTGFQVPFWPEIIDLVKSAASKAKRNRSIGWDVAVTENGPELIEGNHNWCKLLWQLPVKKGLKNELKKYL